MPRRQQHGEHELAIALSGGGHRATLFTLGALMAVVDRGLNRHVTQIASVSGGSITNAFIAQRCEFAELEPGGLDSVVRDLSEQIVTRGSLRRRDIIAVLGGMATAGAFVGLGVALVLHAIAAAAVGLVFTLATMLLTGRFVEWKLQRAFFRERRGDTPLPQSLGELAGRGVDHVFCASDLVLGNPVYFSTMAGGLLYRRTGSVQSVPLSQRWAAGPLHLSDVVRASAAFPGIPPRRMVLDRKRASPSPRRPSLLREVIGDRLFGEDVTPELRARLDAEEEARHSRWPRLCFLGDGGLWNNLGTQVLREDEFYRGGATWSSVPTRLLCVDASSALRPTSSLRFDVPGWSIASWFMRSLQMLYENSVAPRKGEIRASLRRRSRTLDRYSRNNPLDIVVDLESLDEIGYRLQALARHRQEIAASSPEVGQWKLSLLDAVLEWHRKEESPERLAERVTDLIREQPGLQWDESGVIDHHAVEHVTRYQGWGSLRPLSDGDVAIPTTLGTIKRETARRLIARGYLNTWLTTLLLRPSDFQQLDILWSFAERLDTICPSNPARSSTEQDRGRRG
jgi:hypothetical protein